MAKRDTKQCVSLRFFWASAFAPSAVPKLRNSRTGGITSGCGVFFVVRVYTHLLSLLVECPHLLVLFNGQRVRTQKC